MPISTSFPTQCCVWEELDAILLNPARSKIQWYSETNYFSDNNSKRVEEYAGRFLRGHWFFLEPGTEKKWYATYNSKPNGYWYQTAEKMMQKIQRSGHPIFRCTSAMEGGQ